MTDRLPADVPGGAACFKRTIHRAEGLVRVAQHQVRRAQVVERENFVFEVTSDAIERERLLVILQRLRQLAGRIVNQADVVEGYRLAATIGDSPRQGESLPKVIERLLPFA